MDFGNRHHPKVKRSLSCRAHRLISTRREDTAKNDATAEATSPRRKTKNDKSEDDIASPNSSGNDDAFKKRKAKEVVLPPTTTSDVADNGTQEIKVVNSVSSSVEDGIVVEDGTKRKRRKKRRSAPAEEDSCTVQGVEGLGTKVKAAKLVTLGRGVSIRDTQIGLGAGVKAGSHVNILYKGTLADGTIFDKRENRRSPLRFRVGLREVVPGMDMGMDGMRVGGIREIHIPAAMGYGNKETGPIPANSDLKFEVELLSIGKKRPHH